MFPIIIFKQIHFWFFFLNNVLGKKIFVCWNIFFFRNLCSSQTFGRRDMNLERYVVKPINLCTPFAFVAVGIAWMALTFLRAALRPSAVSTCPWKHTSLSLICSLLKLSLSFSGVVHENTEFGILVPGGLLLWNSTATDQYIICNWLNTT